MFDLFGTTLYTASDASSSGPFAAPSKFGYDDPVSLRNGLKLTWGSGNKVIGIVSN
jgi:hypothetical protein